MADRFRFGGISVGSPKGSGGEQAIGQMGNYRRSGQTITLHVLVPNYAEVEVVVGSKVDRCRVRNAQIWGNAGDNGVGKTMRERQLDGGSDERLARHRRLDTIKDTGQMSGESTEKRVSSTCWRRVDYT